MGIHIYPKSRKPKSNTDYAMSTKLIKAMGTDKLNEMLSRHGMYLAAKEISEILSQPISPYVVRYVRRYKLRNGEIKNETNTIRSQNQ